MKSRAIYISSRARLREVDTQYKISLQESCLHRYLFHFSRLSNSQITRFRKKIIPVLDSSSGGGYVRGQNIFLCLNPKSIRSILETDPAMDTDLQKAFNRIQTLLVASPKPVWKLDHGQLDFNRGPFIMGILNVTPDSFSDGGKYPDARSAVDQALLMVEQGAQIIDIGGESSRPGAQRVSAEEEIRRVLPVIEMLRRQSNVLISIDTYKSRVALKALQAGADMVNDISAGVFDPTMVEIVNKFHAAVILMHMKGQPENMQNHPQYEDVTREVYDFLEERVTCFEEAGVRPIAIDPGIGFGKRLEDNLRLIRDLNDFKFLHKPILVGLSRKSFIGTILETDIKDRRDGTLAANVMAWLNGADILRVHDVKATGDALKIAQKIAGRG